MNSLNRFVICALCCGGVASLSAQQAEPVPTPAPVSATTPAQAAPVALSHKGVISHFKPTEVITLKGALKKEQFKSGLFPKVSSSLQVGDILQKGQKIWEVDKKAWEKDLYQFFLGLEQVKQVYEKAQFDYEQGKIYGDINIEKAKKGYARALEDWADYEKILLPKAKEDLEMQLKRAENNVIYRKENLAQLQKMYKEDQITEDSEEIILLRTRNELKEAEEALEAVQINVKLAQERRIPREIEDKKQQLAESKLNAESLAQKVAFELSSKELAMKEAEFKKSSLEEKGRLVEAEDKLTNTLPAVMADKAVLLFFAKQGTQEYPQEATLLPLKNNTFQVISAKGEPAVIVGESVTFALPQPQDSSFKEKVHPFFNGKSFKVTAQEEHPEGTLLTLEYPQS